MLSTQHSVEIATVPCLSEAVYQSVSQGYPYTGHNPIFVTAHEALVRRTHARRQLTHTHADN